jgi:hypothetical protein
MYYCWKNDGADFSHLVLNLLYLYFIQYLLNPIFHREQPTGKHRICFFLLLGNFRYIQILPPNFWTFSTLSLMYVRIIHLATFMQHHFQKLLNPGAPKVTSSKERAPHLHVCCTTQRGGLRLSAAEIPIYCLNLYFLFAQSEAYRLTELFWQKLSSWENETSTWGGGWGRNWKKRKLEKLGTLGTVQKPLGRMTKYRKQGAGKHHEDLQNVGEDVLDNVLTPKVCLVSLQISQEVA